MHVALSKYQKELSLDEKSTETQQLMDLDPPTDAGLVKTLIEDATKKATQKLRAELGQLEKLLKTQQ